MTKKIIILFTCFINFSFAQVDTSLYKVETRRELDELCKYSLTTYGIGPGGEPSRAYLIFDDILANNPSDTLIYFLTKHPKSTVVGFAFKGLKSRNSRLYYNAFKEHVSDTTSMKYLIGCVMFKMQIRDYLAVDSKYIIKNRKLFSLSHSEKREMKHLRKEIIKNRQNKCEYIKQYASLAYEMNPIHWKRFRWAWRWIYFI